MLGDTELKVNSNITVSNKRITLPIETGVEIGEDLLLVHWLDGSYRIVNSRIYEEEVQNVLDKNGYKPNRIIQPENVRKLKRYLLGKGVLSVIKVRKGYKISLGNDYKDVKRVVLSSES